MIPKECPFSDKLKLKLTLKGKPNVCSGYKEKNDKGIYDRCKFCEECSFFDKDILLLEQPWTYQPYNPPSPPGQWVTVTTVTTTNGCYGDNNYTYYLPSGITTNATYAGYADSTGSTVFYTQTVV